MRRSAVRIRRARSRLSPDGPKAVRRGNVTRSIAPRCPSRVCFAVNARLTSTNPPPLGRLATAAANSLFDV
eukprot:11177415-Lingulodinium_polyedra.AAC.1